MLNVSEEIEYIWCKPSSCPMFLYILTRYTILIGQGFYLAGNLLPLSAVSCALLRVSVKYLNSFSRFGNTLRFCLLDRF